MNLFPQHIKLNGQSALVSDLLQHSEKRAEWEKEWVDFLAKWYDPEDFIEAPTSGSTGTPKTIRLKKDFVAASAMRTIRFFSLEENDRVLHCLPSRYIAGKLMIVRALLGKLDLHLVDPATDFKFLQNEHFKFAAMVPNQVSKILDFDPAIAGWLRNFGVEFLLIGGAAIPRSLEEKLQTISTACYSSYAMTETATHIALRKINGEGAHEFYHCLDDIRVELAENGCLRIMMPGLINPYLQTTDLAELKDEKTFRILGRADHVIISGGIKYSPEKLEEKLATSIAQPFMISALPHDTLGQQLVLVVEGNKNRETISQLKTICRQQLSQYEQPRQIIFISQLPRTDNGKIDRQKPSGNLRNGLNSM